MPLPSFQPGQPRLDERGGGEPAGDTRGRLGGITKNKSGENKGWAERKDERMEKWRKKEKEKKRKKRK